MCFSFREELSVKRLFVTVGHETIPRGVDSHARILVTVGHETIPRGVDSIHETLPRGVDSHHSVFWS